MRLLRKMAFMSAGALSLMNLTAVMPAVLSVSAEEKGTWSFDEATGTLTISGEWPDFYNDYDHLSDYSRPWENLKNNAETPVKSVVFGENTTVIPKNVLNGFRTVASVSVPEGTEYIEDSAFAGCSALEQITLPDSLIEIGYSAFHRCTDLESVVVPENVTLIGSEAFEECTNLKEITLPENLTELGVGVFRDTPWLSDRRKDDPLVVVNGVVIDGKNCNGVVQIPDCVRIIGHSAFQKNSEITEVILPESVTKLGSYSFGECPALEKAVIPKQIKCVSDYAFFNCDNLKSVVIEEGVTELGNGAFANCDQLEEITIPKSVNSIETYALSNTLWMKNRQKENPLVIVNYILISGTACKGNVVIPEEVTAIAPYAFEQSELASVVIPEGIREIPFMAFGTCEELRSVTIPDSVTFIDDSAFSSCSKLKEITIPPTVRELDYQVFCDTDVTIKGYTGSPAEAYAKQYEIPFVAIGSVSDQTSELCGDVNADGAFDVSDAVLASRYIIEDKSAFISDAGKRNADVTGDGELTQDDVTAMLQRIAKKIPQFPAEEKK